tara:strand:+ start:407 stop:811 length:405 start_codon:yes stop_codon:yes gene_type:complete
MTQQKTMTFAPTIADRFSEYDSNNPHVWELFKRFTREAHHAGHDRFSAQSVIERIRWETSVETRGGEFKINNNFAAFYARKYHELFPQLDGFFQTRSSQADRYNTYPRALACRSIAIFFIVGSIVSVGLLAFGA